jgi:hypothetical protein
MSGDAPIAVGVTDATNIFNGNMSGCYRALMPIPMC